MFSPFQDISPVPRTAPNPRSNLRQSAVTSAASSLRSPPYEVFRLIPVSSGKKKMQVPKFKKVQLVPDAPEFKRIQLSSKATRSPSRPPWLRAFQRFNQIQLDHVSEKFN